MSDSSDLVLAPYLAAAAAQGDFEANAALGQVQRAISSDFPWASPDHVGEVLCACYERTGGAKVQNFRLVLAERETRAQLRHEQRSSCSSPEGNGDQ